MGSWFTYNAAAEEFATARSKENGKPLANNTRLYYDKEDDEYHVVLHSTRIVSINKDNVYTLNTGGWHSVTTRERMNRYVPAHISGGETGLYVMIGRSWRVQVPIYDGMQLDHHGNILDKNYDLRITAGGSWSNDPLMPCNIEVCEKNYRVKAHFMTEELHVHVHEKGLTLSTKRSMGSAANQKHYEFGINIPKDKAEGLADALYAAFNPLQATYQAPDPKLAVNKENRAIEVEKCEQSSSELATPSLTGSTS